MWTTTALPHFTGLVQMGSWGQWNSWSRTAEMWLWLEIKGRHLCCWHPAMASLRLSSSCCPLVLTSTMQMRWVSSGQCWHQVCRWGESAQDSVDINYADEVSQLRTVLTSTMLMRWVKSGQCWHQLCRWGESSQDSVDDSYADEVSQVRVMLTSTADEANQVRTVLMSAMQMRWVKSGRLWHQLCRWGESTQDSVDVNHAGE